METDFNTVNKSIKAKAELYMNRRDRKFRHTSMILLYVTFQIKSHFSLTPIYIVLTLVLGND